MSLDFEITPVNVTGKTVTCGYCKCTGIPLREDGDLQQHTVPKTTSTVCKGYATWMEMDGSTGKIVRNQ